MKKSLLALFLVLIFVVLLLGGVHRYQKGKTAQSYEADSNTTYASDGITYKKYWSEDLGVSFAYRLAPDGYVLIEADPKAINSTPDVEKFLTLYNEKEYGLFKKQTGAGESPKSISIRVFKNSNNLSVQEWINQNAAQVNFHGTGIRPQPVSYGGVEGLQFHSDGLYQNDVVVLSNNYHMYVFTGEYDSTENMIYSDFYTLLKSLTLF